MFVKHVFHSLQGFIEYKNVKVIHGLIKDLFGDALVGSYISTICYLSQVPQLFMGLRPGAEQVALIQTTLNLCLWITASDHHATMRKSFLKWVEFHINTKVTNTKYIFTLQTLRTELSLDEPSCVGLSTKFFSVTYNFISSVLMMFNM